MSHANAWRFPVPAALGKPLNRSFWRQGPNADNAGARAPADRNFYSRSLYNPARKRVQRIHGALDIGGGVAGIDGAVVVAPVPGIIFYVDHGSALGEHQVELWIPGTAEVYFFAHMKARYGGDGKHVNVGQAIGQVGREGVRSAAAHLHIEHWLHGRNNWSHGPDASCDPYDEFEAVRRKEKAR